MIKLSISITLLITANRPISFTYCNANICFNKECLRNNSNPNYFTCFVFYITLTTNNHRSWKHFPFHIFEHGLDRPVFELQIPFAGIRYNSLMGHWPVTTSLLPLNDTNTQKSRYSMQPVRWEHTIPVCERVEDSTPLIKAINQLSCTPLPPTQKKRLKYAMSYIVVYRTPRVEFMGGGRGRK